MLSKSDIFLLFDAFVCYLDRSLLQGDLPMI